MKCRKCGYEAPRFSTGGDICTACHREQWRLICDTNRAQKEKPKR